MSSEPQPNAQGADELETAIDQAIATCGGDMRATIRTLIVANNFFGIGSRRTDEGSFTRLCAWKISHLFRLGVNHDGGNLFRGVALRRG